jgi:isoleucyl-tRNA synthetase
MPKDGRAIGEAVRGVLLPIWNAYSFFTLYANIDGVKGKLITTDQANLRELDRYILIKTGQLVRSVETAMDRFDLAGACNALPPFIEALNNWYIRRSRDEFWKSEKDALKQEVYDTLYTVLVTLTRTMAPFLPFLTDHIHRALCDDASVHLQDWPDAAPLIETKRSAWVQRDNSTKPAEAYGHDLVEMTDFVREVCSAGAAVRTNQGLRNRLPLRTLTVAHPKLEPGTAFREIFESFERVILDEANVKEVVVADDPARFGSEDIVINPRLVGKRLGAEMKIVLQAAKAGKWERILPSVADGETVTLIDAPAASRLDVEVAGHRIGHEEYEIRFRPAEGLAAAPFDGNAGVVVLDTKITPELEREGLARDFIRLVQVARKDAGFNVADRIAIEVKAGPVAEAAIAAHLADVKRETLAVSFATTGGVPAGTVSEGKLGDEAIALGVAVAR